MTENFYFCEGKNSAGKCTIGMLFFCSGFSSLQDKKKPVIFKKILSMSPIPYFHTYPDNMYFLNVHLLFQ